MPPSAPILTLPAAVRPRARLWTRGIGKIREGLPPAAPNGVYFLDAYVLRLCPGRGMAGNPKSGSSGCRTWRPTRSLQDRDHDLLDAGGDLALHAGRGKLMPGAAAHPHLSQDVPVAVLVEDELGLGVLSGLEAVGQGKRAVVVAPNEQSALRGRNVVGSGRKRRPADRETERDLAPDLGRFDGRGKGREHGHETHRPETLEKLLRHLTLLGRRVVAAAMKDESSRGLFGAGPKS